MQLLKVTITVLSLTLPFSNLLAQETNLHDSLSSISEDLKTDFTSVNYSEISCNTSINTLQFLNKPVIDFESPICLSNPLKGVDQYGQSVQKKLLFSKPKFILNSGEIDMVTMEDKKDFFLNNRRHRYSSLWAFTSLNYLYADLVGVMDKNKLVQYQTGVVEGVKITPQFLTVAAAFMQIPLANVFLPQLIKNERALRWVQIASGTIMTVVQSGTLFVGKPTPYYALFSAFEIADTSYITIDAIKWKTKSNKKKLVTE
ncbi:MAG: hypothetical protein JNJ40_00550 [Bacteroidia bacterium]|nr:hypothetical protein [Bacteroidia bacterium]